MRHTMYCVCLDNLNPRRNCTSSEMLMLHKLHWVMKYIFSQQMWFKLKNDIENKQCKNYFVALLPISVHKL